MCAWKGCVPCVRVCWGQHTRLKITHLCSPACMVNICAHCHRVILCLVRGLSCWALLIYTSMGTPDNDGWRRTYYMWTHTQIKRDNSKCLFWVYERGGQTPSSRSLSGHHVPSLNERSPVLGGWTETERGFFVLCNYTIVLALYPNLN